MNRQSAAVIFILSTASIIIAITKRPDSKQQESTTCLKSSASFALWIQRRVPNLVCGTMVVGVRNWRIQEDATATKERYDVETVPAFRFKKRGDGL